VNKKESSQTYHEGKKASRIEEREAQKSKVNVETLLEKERVVNGAFLK